MHKVSVAEWSETLDAFNRLASKIRLGGNVALASEMSAVSRKAHQWGYTQQILAAEAANATIDFEIELELSLQEDSWGGQWAYATIVGVQGRAVNYGGGGYCGRYRDDEESHCFLVAVEDACSVFTGEDLGSEEP